jgi:hypothetical protein
VVIRQSSENLARIVNESEITTESLALQGGEEVRK